MHTLRQKDGISGYTSRSESEFDPFAAGHGCNSISAGLGIFFSPSEYLLQYTWSLYSNIFTTWVNLFSQKTRTHALTVPS